MGDIQRKLGRSAESERVYRKAIDILTTLVVAPHAARETKQALARTRALLGDLLVRHGGDKGQAEPLYEQAIKAQQALALGADATLDDRLRLGETLKSQGELLRLNGKFTEAGSVFDKAVTVLTEAHTVAGKNGVVRDGLESAIRNDLALTVDARGWIHREVGELKQAEEAYRRALKLLDELVREFPTIPRHRESLARAYNSLALIEETDGRLADAETHLRSELPLVERLSQDFADRPEHQRELARTLMNLGNVLSDQNHFEARNQFCRALEVNSTIATKDPSDVQIQLDLSKCHNNLGDLVRQKGETQEALDLFRKARSIDETLVKISPDKPRYRESLAGTLVNLALVQEREEPAKVEETYRTAEAIYEKLIADHPANIDYRIGLARCLRNQGAVIAAGERLDQAEAVYRKGLAKLNVPDAKSRSIESHRLEAELLINLGELRRPGAEQAYQQSIAISEKLMASTSSASKERHNLAIAQNNLGDHLIAANRLLEARGFLEKSAANFEQLITEAPKSIERQSHFGVVLATQGKWFDLSGQPAQAKAALENAIDHQRQAARLSKNAYSYRTLLGEHSIELAKLDLKQGTYDEAARIALDVPSIVPTSGAHQPALNPPGSWLGSSPKLAAMASF